MVIQMNLMAALLTVLLRNLLKRVPFVQTPVISSGSNLLFSPHAFLIGGAFCFLTGRCRNWLWRGSDETGAKLRTPIHEQSYLLSENRIEKAKLRVNNHFHAYRRLQQSAVLHLVNEASNTEPSQQQINAIPTSSSIVPKNNGKSELSLRQRMRKRNYLLSGLPDDFVRRTRSGRVYGIRDRQ